MASLVKKTSRLDLEIKIYLAELLQSILNDPEYFLDLKEDTKKKLKELRSKQAITISLDKVKRKYFK